jgi:hypothetical protein
LRTVNKDLFKVKQRVFEKKKLVSGRGEALPDKQEFESALLAQRFAQRGELGAQVDQLAFEPVETILGRR